MINKYRKCSTAKVLAKYLIFCLDFLKQVFIFVDWNLDLILPLVNFINRNVLVRIILLSIAYGGVTSEINGDSFFIKTPVIF